MEFLKAMNIVYDLAKDGATANPGSRYPGEEDAAKLRYELEQEALATARKFIDLLLED